MGLKFRKSINLGGGFRINLSKSGVGYSWGIPGYRITKTANGRTRKTYSIPGTGISYVDEKGRRKNVQNEKRQYNPSLSVSTMDNVQNIESAPIEEFQNVEYRELTEKISQTIKLNTVSNILLCCILLIGMPPLFILPLAGVIIKIILYTKGKINLEYTLEEDIEYRYKEKMQQWLYLNNCNKVWQDIQFSNVTNKKINAGASTNIKRIPFKFTRKTPFYLSMNVETVQMVLKQEKLILLPDKILIIRGSKVGAVNYNSVSIKISDIRFIESMGVPKDAQIIDYTWQFVNKNGSPDRRYKNNRKLPVCLYSQINITSPEGLNVELQCSNTKIAHEFKREVAI